MVEVIQDSYLIDFIDHQTGDLLYQIGSSQALTMSYDIKLNDIGILSMAIPYEAWLDSILTPDTMIEIRRLNPISGTRSIQDTYLLQRWQRFLDEALNTQIVLGAVSLNHLLSRRVIDHEDDPLGVAEYVTRDGEASEVMRNYAYYQLGGGASADRKLSELLITYDESGDLVGGDYTYSHSLFKVLSELAIQGGVDFAIQRTTSNLLTLAIGQIGSNKQYNGTGTTSLAFAISTGALLQPSLMTNREEEVNTVYVALDGEPGIRTVISRQSAEVSASDWNRKEGFLELGRENDEGSYAAITKSSEYLNKNRHKEDFSFNIDPNSRLLAYGVDWFIGDRVTMNWGDTTKNMRISGVKGSYQDGSESVKVLLSSEVSI